MNKKHSYAFLMEYGFVLLMFSICAAICISIFTSSYRRNDIANKTKDALQVTTAYIENGDYTNRSFSIDNINYEVKDVDNEYKHLMIVAEYKNEELFNIEFYGDEYEKR